MWPSFTVPVLVLLLITSLNAQDWYQRSGSGLEYFVSSSSLPSFCGGAVAICQENSAILVTVNNDEDKTYLDSITSDSSDSFFIGLYKPANQALPPTWRDGSVYTPAASDWKFGSFPIFNQATCYCTVQNKDNTSSWSIATCRESHRYVCQRDTDVCDVNMCSNGATCSKNLTRRFGYNCECADGWSGILCSDDINECDSAVCLKFNGATCVNTPGSYSCSCADGYTGQNCETDTDECESITCLNNAMCQDLVNSYRCDCLDGFEGDLCGTDIDECENITCLNNATCRDLVNGYRCDCLDGFEGDLCWAKINECDSSPCLNNGICQDELNHFTCDCLPGFKGELCDIAVTTAASTTDINGVSMTSKTLTSALTTPNQGTNPPNVEETTSPNTASTASVCHILLTLFSLCCIYLI